MEEGVQLDCMHCVHVSCITAHSWGLEDVHLHGKHEGLVVHFLIARMPTWQCPCADVELGPPPTLSLLYLGQQPSSAHTLAELVFLYY